MRPPRPPSGADPYAAHAAGYTATRRTDPRIAEHVWAALGSARTVLNVGAGAGSYEPPDREVVAVEPSAAMAAQHPGTVVRAAAEALPFADGAFDAAMAVLSDHHWADPLAGLREMARVARRVVVFQWDGAFVDRVWLTRDYLPEFRGLMAGPTLADRAALLGAAMAPVPIPWDCVDGFFHAFWRRPEAYLDERVRRGSSVWRRVGPEVEARVVSELSRDLAGGAWRARNAELLALDAYDCGYRLLVTG